MQREGTARHRGVAVFGREPGQGVGGGVQVGADQPECGARDQHGAGVEHVLAGGSAVDVFGGGWVLRRHHLGEGPYEAHHRVGGLARSDGDRTQVEPFGAGRAGDGVGGGHRQGAQPGLGAGQRGFGVEHGLEPCRVAHRRLGGGARAHRREEARVGQGVAHTITPVRWVPPAAAGRAGVRGAGDRDRMVRAIASASPRLTESTPGRIPAAVTQCTDSVGTP